MFERLGVRTHSETRANYEILIHILGELFIIKKISNLHPVYNILKQQK